MSSPNIPDMPPEEREMHLSFMREAIAVAKSALLVSETPVGCIFTYSSPTTSLTSPSSPSSSTPSTPPTKPIILARGHNHTNATFNGTRHAEFVALNQILTSPLPSSISLPSEGIEGRLGLLRECTLYVTVEPCIMCASLLRQFGIKKVFFGAVNDKFGGTGGVLNVHLGNGRGDSFPERSEWVKGGKEGMEGEQEEGKVDSKGEGGGTEEIGREGKKEVGGEWEEGDYEVSGGWLREEAILLLRRFYVQENERAPEEKRGKEGRVVREDFD